mmetsp:Transcript_25916/g.47359  ORF Transcript_25916/g.47359 Transcript_25916/m.47359 type:complete len:713 (-) Transcript_25916:486-2624(-)|eukprot:CAMPEP_0175064550 /NCGR_PEP_ID=MMETSP0052_2-20121109/15399_1 /TAXON_ID=51329 ORGANISM="Polytomella parva, Strain SAG 63-3" /NCGR_SAMPLE_ID=MMETSP0052_2 /ASSEMBLY_ACC=CAM_ASM_000194 /LENGTH=712 /DNA_ID=CAMNT_0016330921 /DNA_START=29 /DNA_END=2167 /DNA_ORIENTATION=-
MAVDGVVAAPESQVSMTPSYASKSLHTLFVNNLSPAVTEKVLRDAFKKVEPMITARVCRDNLFGASLGHGYVNFSTSQAAQEALELMNCKKLLGQTIHVAPYDPEPSSRRRCEGNLVLKSFPKDVSEREIYEKFSALGRVFSCKIVGNGSLAFLQFYAKEDAEKAIQEWNGKDWNGTVLEINHYIRKTKQADVNIRSLFINKLPEKLTEDNLNSFFSKFEGFKRVRIIHDAVDPLPYVLVSFLTYPHTRNALQTLLSDGVDGVQVDANYYGCMDMQVRIAKSVNLVHERCLNLSNTFRHPYNSLVVKNLPRGSTIESIQEFFRSLGVTAPEQIGIIDANVERVRAVACFERRDDCVKALKAIQGKAIEAETAAAAEVSESKKEEEKKSEEGVIPMAAKDEEQAVADSAVATRRVRGRTPIIPVAYQLRGSNNRYSEYFLRRYEGAFEQQGGNNNATPSFNTLPLAGRAPSGVSPDGGMIYSPAATQMVYPDNFSFYVPYDVSKMPYMQNVNANNGNVERRGNNHQGPYHHNNRRGGGNNNRYNNNRQEGGPRRHYNNNRHNNNGHDRNNTNNGNYYNTAAPDASAAVANATDASQAVIAPTAVVETPDVAAEIQEPLTAAGLVAMDDEQQKAALGNRLYVMVEKVSDDMSQELAQKITGMFMELDVSELVLMLENPVALAQNVDEAVKVLDSNNFFTETIVKPTIVIPEPSK